MKVTYQEVSIELIMSYFAKDFDNVVDYKYFIDVNKGVVVFKLTTEEEPSHD